MIPKSGNRFSEKIMLNQGASAKSTIAEELSRSRRQDSRRPSTRTVSDQRAALRQVLAGTERELERFGSAGRDWLSDDGASG